ncbi:MAG: YebC/PmpR family DNA-binding transcriptional regulator [Dehalococcoidia bacterium]
MSGHSKWSQIKRQKGVADAKRAQVFTRLGRELTIAAKHGGPDPEGNPRLRLAIDHAREANMPKETIERAIKRGTGHEAGSVELQEIVYEGYSPGGAAILVEALTDNRNRTAAEVRNTFAKAGGNLGESGSVAWIFDMRGLINVDANGADPDELGLLAIDSGADDVKVDGTSVEIYTAPDQLEAVRRALAAGGIAVASSELVQLPKTTVSLEARQAEQVLRLLDRLDDLDDVQRVSSNADFPDEVLAAYA